MFNNDQITFVPDTVQLLGTEHITLFLKENILNSHLLCRLVISYTCLKNNLTKYLTQVNITRSQMCDAPDKSLHKKPMP